MSSTPETELRRTHMCGELTSENIGQVVRLCGWVSSCRNHGGVIFINLRDREGVTQVLVNPSDDEQVYKLAKALRNEWVVSAAGTVRARPEGMRNPKMPTGDVEIVCENLAVLNRADPVPFEPDIPEKVSEETRLKYRYIDIRRSELTGALVMRHRITKCIRDYYDAEGFIEVETPFLTKSTPEGARDFLVPSRMQQGTFYALPQSPQLFKQLLMIGGMDKYMQIVRCFRDEDLRADRQPEFTQVDVEMSFVTCQDVIRVNEGAMRVVAKLCDVPFPETVKVLSYDHAMRDFGTDRPDLRFEMTLHDVTDLAKGSDFKVFASVADAKGLVKGLTAKGGAAFTRSQIDGLAEFCRELGAKGLAWAKVLDDGTLSGSLAKFFTADKCDALKAAMDAQPGDCMMFVADEPKTTNKVLAALRCKLGKDMGLCGRDLWAWCWVVDFPLLEWDQLEQRWSACHHPFTAPLDEDVHLLDSDPGKVRSKAYDLILNGTELGGGSVRIHDVSVQKKVFDTLKISEQESRAKFGFLLDALRFGAPPHGGIAFGLDRIVMIMLQRDSLRDVIAFPKTTSGGCPLTGAPAAVDDKQLAELDIRVIRPPAGLPMPPDDAG
ncbi:MAG: aspartate--tRNA ligase [Planctomycetes bacterium]|nr:aspartate--tRNA ligase [Planctomycetota bacterium]